MIILAVAIVAVIGTASVAGYLILSDDNDIDDTDDNNDTDDNDNNDIDDNNDDDNNDIDDTDDNETDESRIGEYMIYAIVGKIGFADLDGTFRIKIIDENSSQYLVETSYDVHCMWDGKRFEFKVESGQEWVDISTYGYYGTKIGSETVNTKWGIQDTDVYTEEDKEGATKAYVGEDGVAYKLEIKMYAHYLTFILTATNLIEDAPVRGIGDYVIYSVSGTEEDATVNGTYLSRIVDQSDTQYKILDIFAIYVTESDVRYELIVDSATSWEDKDSESESVKTGTGTITTAWGLRNVNIYTQTEDEVIITTYVGSSDGVIYKQTISVDESILSFDLVGTNLI